MQNDIQVKVVFDADAFTAEVRRGVAKAINDVMDRLGDFVKVVSGELKQPSPYSDGQMAGRGPENHHGPFPPMPPPDKELVELLEKDRQERFAVKPAPGDVYYERQTIEPEDVGEIQF